jgi:hypothetical protein
MTAPTYTAEQVAAAVKAALEGAAAECDYYDKWLPATSAERLENSRRIRALAADPQAVARFVEAGKT